jgi:heat shock protein HtpX
MDTGLHRALMCACHHPVMARPAQFGRDTGLQVRMLTTMFLLGLVYVVFAGVIFAAGGSAIAIVLFAVVMLSFQFFASDALALRAMGAKEVSPAEAPELHAMIERLCIQADIPKPRIAVADTQMPNAFAMGRSQKHATVCATTGILNLLSPSELEGVMAHEITHIVNRDVAIMTMASFFASIAAMIVQFGFFFGGGFGGGYGNSDDDDNSSVMMLILVSALVYAISFLLMQALSRYREYAADRGSAVITGRPSALSSALLKLNGAMQRTPTQDLRAAGEMNAFFIVPANVKNSIYGLFATHPPMEKRIEALSRLEAQLQSGARPVAA